MVTIKDVAKRAGVNASTVSRVLKDSSAISQLTKERVRQAMDDLGYVPNRAAQMLASGLTQCVGVVLPPLTTPDRVSEPFFMEILTAINDQAKQQGFTVSIATSNSVEDLAEQVKLMYRQKRADGFLILYSEKDDPVQDYLSSENIPFVVIGTPIEADPNLISIDNDNQLMGEEAVKYLQRKGHKKLLFVTDDLTSRVCLDRYRGYQQAIEQLNLPVQPILLFDRKDPTTLDLLIETVQREKITGLIVIGDLLSIRVIQFLSFYGLRVPDDLSLISFNNSIFSKMLHPYLTTFDINVAQLGQTSLIRLLDIIENRQQPSTEVIVPFNLKERESVRDLYR